MINELIIQKILASAITKAKELGLSISVAVVDTHGTLLGFLRMNNAIPISTKFSINKAYTSGTIGMPTHALASFALPGQPYHDLNSIFGGELTTIAGGLPIKIDNTVVGGIGVGGSMDVNQDIACAEAGLLAINN